MRQEKPERPEKSEKGKLYLVPAPIGNLGDITRRALEALELSEIIACEDTRVSGKLLAHYGIKKKLLSYHDFNEEKQVPKLLEVILSGEMFRLLPMPVRPDCRIRPIGLSGRLSKMMLSSPRFPGRMLLSRL